MRSFRTPQHSGGGATIVEVFHRPAEGRWPYGSAIGVMGTDSALRWVGDFWGDYVPHTFGWVDANGDGRRDLYVLAGEEEVFQTWVFVDPDGRKDLIEVLYDSLSYMGVVDLDGDRRPEFVGFASDIGMATGDPDVCPNREAPPLPAEIEALGYRALDLFPGMNFDYAMGPELAARWAVKFDDPVRIWVVRGTSAVDVTSRFKSHVKAQRAYAIERRTGASDECLAELDVVVAYFDRVLGDR